MRVAAVAVVGVAGILAGLFFGFALWGVEDVTMRQTLEKTTVELETTQAWLRDEIRTSDERLALVSEKLTKALADLSRARAQLARSGASAKPSVPSALPRESAAPAADRALTGD